MAASRSTGLGIGGVWGLREGARRPLAVSNTRLRINSVLNSVTRRGTFIGNSAGVLGVLVFITQLSPMISDKSHPSLALVYNAINSSIDHWRGRHDIVGSMTAGGITGAIYKSTGQSIWSPAFVLFLPF
jgi:import inner membrane translocase subunit TIM23